MVPKHLGFGHISRQTLLQEHSRPLAQALFANDDPAVAILILDGTYLYCQKSACHRLQRACYSMHKNRPLVKPMMIVATDGYIVSAMGPYLANYQNNDANITEHILLTDQEGIRTCLRPKDVFIVDRGFRDCIPLLNQLHFDTFMPAFLGRNEKQFETSTANQTRFVTSVRWIVEYVNGQIKQWRMFDRVIPNTLLPSIGQWFRILCALLNFSRPKLKKDTQKELDLARTMRAKKDSSNKLKDYISRIDSKAVNSLNWKSMDANDAVPDFPRLSYDDMVAITLGTYQLRQARCYAIEHLSTNGWFAMKVAKQRQDIILGRIQSKHSNRKKYDVWLQYTSAGVESWYCRCKSGSRDLGCCSHVACLIYYLGFARHQPEVLRERASSYFNNLIDASDRPDALFASSDEDDEEDESTECSTDSGESG